MTQEDLMATRQRGVDFAKEHVATLAGEIIGEWRLFKRNFNVLIPLEYVCVLFSFYEQQHNHHHFFVASRRLVQLASRHLRHK